MGFYGILWDFIVIQWDMNGIYPLVMTNSLLLKMAIEIVDFPINSMMIFHSYVNVYRRVLQQLQHQHH